MMRVGRSIAFERRGVVSHRLVEIFWCDFQRELVVVAIVNHLLQQIAGVTAAERPGASVIVSLDQVINNRRRAFDLVFLGKYLEQQVKLLRRRIAELDFERNSSQERIVR